MVNKSKAFSSFSVDDIVKAREFYTNVLGLTVKEGGMEGILELYIKESNPVIIYPKPNHEPASFTILNFPVPDIEEAVSSLKDKGVIFESYDYKELKTESNNIFRGDGPHIAWFKDPAGNILSIIQE
ncbi:VOC family protein [Flavobacterium arcticum]|uniref:VOC family protein n=1 Tax=Flavobacterium arcticum TaxID=1784713 RepID=A0A345H9M1_9FLAO|nr:VOC family protein [Flavobacterium arcticum]AXG73281.1 VOC family protein [Flavobacterium arcticum]KAF2513076.1 VOC family protein [Flavobacterium arcticum]